MRLISSLIVIALTPICMVFGAIDELGNTFRHLQDIWSEEL